MGGGFDEGDFRLEIAGDPTGRLGLGNIFRSHSNIGKGRDRNELTKGSARAFGGQ